MRMPNIDIGRIIKDELSAQSPITSFESIWVAKLRKDQSRSNGRKRITVSLITLFLLTAIGFSAYSVFRRVDKTDYPFIDDKRVLGRWNTVDFVDNVTEFTPGKKAAKDELYLSALVFIKNGKMLMAANGKNLAFTTFTWTKDVVLNKQDKTAGKYLIKEHNGEIYLFFEWKSGDYSFRNQTPSYYVLKQADHNDYSEYKPKQIREDKTDYPFIDDPLVKGQWETVDFVESIEDYQAGKTTWMGDLFLEKLIFEEGGKLTFTFPSKTFSNPSVTWTKGFIINKTEKTLSACTIKKINDTSFLFFEWKSGDYTYRGVKPMLYVLRKTG